MDYFDVVEFLMLKIFWNFEDVFFDFFYKFLVFIMVLMEGLCCLMLLFLLISLICDNGGNNKVFKRLY